MKFGWYSIVFREGNAFDSILNGIIYKTEEECKEKIKLTKEEDKKNKWGDYTYSKPNIITLPE
jgi:hypothetical protein